MIVLALLGPLGSGCTGEDGGWGLNGQHNPVPGGGDDTGGATDTADTADTAADTADTFGQACALQEGATACDLRAVASSGGDWTLWGSRPGPVLLLVGHAWDDAMQRNSAALPTVAQGRVVQPVAVLVDNLYLQTASAQDAAAWSAQYGLPLTVADVYGEARAAWIQTSQAQTWLMDEQLTLTWIGYGAWDAAQVGARVDALAED